MTAIVVIFVVLLGAWMAVRGYRRGALAVILGWLPMLLLAGSMYFAVHFGWTEPGSIKAKVMAGAAVAILLFMVGSGIYRIISERDNVKPGDEKAPETWLSRINRACGAILGLACCMIYCLAISALIGTVVFGVTVAREKEIVSGAEPEPVPQWVDLMREASIKLADIGDAGFLSHIPRLDEYSGEIRAMITVLNAPREKLQKIVEKRDLMGLAEVPEVKDALRDKEYRRLIDRIREGDLMALDSLARDPKTKNLLDCPEIRELAQRLKPSDLAKDMESDGPSEQLEKQ